MHIVLEHASKRYENRNVFDNISLSFPLNQVTALIGPSGSGKSTVLAVISGVESLDHGKVYINSITQGISAPRPEDFTWVVQNNALLLNRSVKDNVLIGALGSGMSLGDADAVAVHWLENVGLAERQESRTVHLSGGERQRVGFARALASGRPYILADEPSSSLDEENTRQLAALMTGALAKRTIILATHDPLMIASATQVCDMRSAKYETDGSRGGSV
jgi:putative ABC transport system ATP-binding protein